MSPMHSSEEPTWDGADMPMMGHLAELRTRLITCVASLVIFALLLFWPSPFVIHWLVATYFPGVVLHAFSPTDVIGTEFYFSLYGALVLSLPVLVYQIWMFIVPAFHPKTRRYVYAYTAPSVLLAVAGVLFCHFFILPRVVAALLKMTRDIAETTFGISSTINLILAMFLAFALIFQTPVVMVCLARIGLINVRMLRKSRRYTLMGTLLVGGIAAPDGSPLTMCLLAIPLYALFEISIVIISVLERVWRKDGVGRGK